MCSKVKIALIIFILTGFHLDISYAKDPEIWTLFLDKQTELIGYKDSNKNIKINPKFTFAMDRQFKNIIAVYEQIDKNHYESYYLLKNGKKVGIDSLYLWDNAPDCENEGKIRFRDKTIDKVGFFDKNGEKIVPALYNDASPFRNNMAVVLENAEKTCLNGEKYSDQNKCEHPMWIGGQTHIINDKNEILVKNFKYGRNLDWFSLKIMGAEKKDLIRETFKGTNGKYYSFINFEKEFNQWFKSKFLTAQNINSIEDICFTNITFWSESKSEWIKIEAASFLIKNKEVLLRQINAFYKGTLQYSARKGDLNPYIFDSENYARYFDSCGNSRKWHNPVFTIIASHRDKKGILNLDYKNYFEFLKADSGYKLISLGVKDKELK